MVLPARGLANLGIGVSQAEKPVLGKEGIGHLILSELREIPDRPCCLRRILRIRRRIQPSSGANVERWLCLKYSNQPRSVRLRFSMIWDRLCPAVRLVLARTVSPAFARAGS